MHPRRHLVLDSSCLQLHINSMISLSSGIILWKLLVNYRSFYQVVLVAFQFLWSSNMIIATIIKECIQLGLTYSFTEFIHYHHGTKHGNFQADMVVEKKLRILYLDLQAAGRFGLLIPQIPPPRDIIPPSKPHLLHKGHTSISVNPYGTIGANFFKPTHSAPRTPMGS